MKTLNKIKFLALLFPLLFMMGTASADEIVGTISSDGGGSGAVVVVIPVASLSAGTYTGTQTVTLTAANSSEIRYFWNNTTDSNSALTCNSGISIQSGGTISINESGLLRAISCYGSHPSPLASFNYVIEAEVITPPAGGGGGGGGGGSSRRNRDNNDDNQAVVTTANWDFNEDKNVDIFDFNILMVNWGTSSGAVKATGDADGDGDVDIFDFNLLIINWQS